MALQARCGSTEPHGYHRTQDQQGYCLGNENVIVAQESQPITDAQADRAIDHARKLGREHGRNAGTWYEIDDEATARRILDGIEDGDPEILDTLPSPDLSGQWAGVMTGPELVESAMEWAGLSSEDDADANAETADALFSDVCDAYEDAFREAAQDEVERSARVALS